MRDVIVFANEMNVPGSGKKNEPLTDAEKEAAIKEIELKAHSLYAALKDSGQKIELTRFVDSRTGKSTFRPRVIPLQQSGVANERLLNLF